MKSAYIISNRELIQILGVHLREQGFNTSDMSIRFTSTNAVVAGITKVKSVEDEPEDFDESEEDNDEDEDEMAALGLAVLVLDELNSSPRTAKALATKMGVEIHDIGRALAELQSTGQVAKVAPAREDGETVSMFMRTGTEAFGTFVEREQLRVAAQVEKWAPYVIAHAPKFYEEGGDRMAILERVCEGLDHEQAEELRADCRNVFYGMADQMLYHSRNAWKAYRTEADEQNLDMLSRAVREVEGHESMSVTEVAEKLPGEVDLGLLRHAMRG
jgi:hypothetical protein